MLSEKKMGEVKKTCGIFLVANCNFRPLRNVENLFPRDAIRQSAFAAGAPPRTPLEELASLPHRAVFKEGANWFKHSSKDVGNLLSRDAF